MKSEGKAPEYDWERGEELIPQMVFILDMILWSRILIALLYLKWPKTIVLHSLNIMAMFTMMSMLPNSG